jgi:outer membrane protein OmpA-like peptidoglycan-associated protein
VKALRFAGLAPLALAAACATQPQPNSALESARTSYRQAAAHAEVPLRAPGELQIAERSLAEAERLARSGADPALVSHQAYLADQRARIAMATADYRKAEAQVATSGEQRNRVLLESRTRQLEQLELQKQAREAQQPVAQPTERGLVFTLSADLLFDSGQAVLKPGGEKTLETIARAVRKPPEQKIVIEGFTDSTGPAELNRRLSEERAQAVKAALVSRGVDPQRVEARGYGPAYPVASNETPVGRQLNRRVQVVIATGLQ